MIDFVGEPPGLSRRKQGFETPTGRQPAFMPLIVLDDFAELANDPLRLASLVRGLFGNCLLGEPFLIGSARVALHLGKRLVAGYRRDLL